MKKSDKKKLAAYATAAGAALAVAAPASADIVETNLTTPILVSDTPVNLDLNDDGNIDFRALVSPRGSIFGVGSSYSSYYYYNSVMVGQDYAILNFSQSDTLNFERPLSPYGYLFDDGDPGFNFNDPNGGYVGVIFDLDGDFGTDDLTLGWIHISEVATDYKSFTIDGWAYNNDPNAKELHIAGSQPIPEPGTLALLATGAAGLAALGRRRQTNK